MANIDKAFDVNTLSLEDSVLITSGSDNPSVVGYEAPIGSLFLCQPISGSGELFIKYGSLDTEWKQVTAGLVDELVKVSNNDTTAGTLSTKLVAGTNISVVETNDGGNETLVINNTAPLATGDLSALTVGLSTGIAIPTSFTNVLWDVTHIENYPNTLEHDTTNLDRILIKETGLYLISFSMSFDADVGEEVISGQVLVNDTNIIPGSLRTASEDGEINDLSNVFVANLTAGTYITFQHQASGTGNVLTNTTTFTVIRARGSQGANGVGLYAWSRTAADGSILDSRGLAVVKTGTGIYDYTLTQPTASANYAISHSIISPATLTDINIFITNVTTNGFTVIIGQGDNGGTPDVPTDVEHSIQIHGPEGPPGITSAYESWLNVGNSGTEQDFLNSLIGPQGPIGQTGSGSNVNLQENGILVLNTPHSILNFVDMTVSDAGSGTANIQNVFGSEYNYVEDDTVTTTTSTTYLTKLTLNVTVPSGTYRIGWNYQWNHDNTGNDFVARIRQDNSTDLMKHKQEPKDSAGVFSTTGTSQQYQTAGFKQITLNGSHQFELQFKTDTAGDESSIWNARMELWRIS